MSEKPLSDLALRILLASSRFILRSSVILGIDFFSVFTIYIRIAHNKNFLCPG